MIRKKGINKTYLRFFLGAQIALLSSFVIASPQGGSVQAGSITIGSNPSQGIDTLITQTTEKGIINWQSFSIGQNEHTHFAQPDTSSVTLNRVVGSSLSSILGRLTSTGHVWLINPSGVLFGSGATVNVGSLLATTANIGNSDFMSGNYYFLQGTGGGSIINQGSIKAANNGLAFLIAPNVENSGVIEANLGKVALGSLPSGSSYVLDFYGDNLIQFAVPSGPKGEIDTAIKQSGKIKADGGRVLLTAATAERVVNQSINMSGIIEANTLASKGGSVILSGGQHGVVSVTGSIKARGNNQGEKGGNIKIEGEKIGLFGNAMIDVSGMAGGGKVLVGADYLGSGGTIVPTAPATYIGSGVNIHANALEDGDGGDIIIWSKNATRFYGTANAAGGVLGGNGGFIETSGGWLDVSGAHINVSSALGKAGSWLLDPFDVIIQSGSGTTPPLSDGGAVISWTAGSNSSIVYLQDIMNAIDNSNPNNDAMVSISTGTDGGATPTGNITLSTGLTDTGLATSNRHILQLIANNNILINSDVNLNTLYLELYAQNMVYVNANIVAPSLYVGGAMTIGAPYSITTFGGGQEYSGAITLSNNTTFKDDFGGSIYFGGTIDGPYALNVNISGVTREYSDDPYVGNITFADNLGGSQNLASLNLSSSAGTIKINTSTINTSGGQVYNAPVLVGANTTMTAGQNITFVNNIQGPYSLSAISTGGNITLNGSVSGASNNPISDLYLKVNAPNNNIYLNLESISTSGSQNYSGNVVFGATSPTTVNLSTTNGALTFQNNITYDNDNNWDLSLNLNLIGGGSAGDITLNGVSGVISLALEGMNKLLNGSIDIISLTTGSSGQTTINTPTLGLSTATFNDSVILATDVIVNAPGAGMIDFGNTIDSLEGTSHSLTITQSGLNVRFGGNVGLNNPLSSLNLTGTNSNYSNNISILAANINTIYDQAYGGEVLLYEQNTSLNSNLGNITFDGAVVGYSGSTNFSVKAGHSVTLNNDVGANSTIGSLNITSGNKININGSNVRYLKTVGDQSYNGQIVFTGTSNVIKMLSESGDIKIFQGISYLGDLVVRGASAIFGGDVTLGGNLSVTTGGNIDTSSNHQIYTGGQISLSGNINTVGNQIYNRGQMWLQTDSQLRSSSGGILLNSSVKSNNSETLTVSAAQNLTIVQDIDIGTLNLDVSGNINLYTDNIVTAKDQLYNGRVVVGGTDILSTAWVDNETQYEFMVEKYDVAKDVHIKATNGSITFNNSVVGTSNYTVNLSINAGSISSSVPPPTSTGNNTSSGGSTGGSGGGADNSDNSDGGSSDNDPDPSITVNPSGGDSPSNEVINSAGNITLKDVSNIGNLELIGKNKMLSGTISVGNLTSTAVNGVSGSNTFLGYNVNELKISTTGNQTYTDTVSLSKLVTLEAGQGDIRFNSNIVGLPASGSNLILNTRGNLNFNQDVGSYSNPLGNIYIRNANNVNSLEAIYTTSFTQAGGTGATNINWLYAGKGGAGDYRPSYSVYGPAGAGVGTGTGLAIIMNKTINATVDVGFLALGSSLPYANINGFVYGQSDWRYAMRFITTVKGYPIGSGSYYFNSVDLFGKLAHEGGIGLDAIGLILEAIKANYGFGFTMNYTKDNNAWDYMLLLSPTSCDVSG
jgi:filamentous hemagglutinin family protein